MAETSWDDVTVLRKRPQREKRVTGAQANQALRMGTVSTQRRSAVATNTAHHVNTDHQRIARLDRENDVRAPKTVPLATGKVIQQTRQKLNLTTKDLANMINEKQSVVSEYESGRAIVNQQILAKFERALKVKLRGKNVGEPLAPKSASPSSTSSSKK